MPTKKKGCLKGSGKKNGECMDCFFMCFTPLGVWKCLCDTSENFKKLHRECKPCICYKYGNDLFDELHLFDNENEMAEYMNSYFK